MITQDQIKKISQDVIADRAQKAQFILVPIPYHVHNGQDSPRLAAENLDFTNFAIWGTVTLSANTASIENANITTDSVILVTGQTSDLSTIAASCSDGVAVITGVGSEVVNYLIIFVPTPQA